MYIIYIFLQNPQKSPHFSFDIAGSCGFCYGFCATSQGSLDWLEVHPSARPASLFI